MDSASSSVAPGRRDESVHRNSRPVVPASSPSGRSPQNLDSTRQVTGSKDVMSDDTPIGLTFQPGIYDRAMAAVPQDRETRILDAGTGQGFMARKLLDAGYERVQACDFSAENFKVDAVPFSECNLNEGLPYADESFDCVLSLEVAEHIEQHATIC